MATMMAASDGYRCQCPPGLSTSPPPLRLISPLHPPPLPLSLRFSPRARARIIRPAARLRRAGRPHCLAAQAAQVSGADCVPPPSFRTCGGAPPRRRTASSPRVPRLSHSGSPSHNTLCAPGAASDVGRRPLARSPPPPRSRPPCAPSVRPSAAARRCVCVRRSIPPPSITTAAAAIQRPTGPVLFCEGFLFGGG